MNYYASSNQITYNNVFNNTYGIRVRYESNNCIIRANNITNNSYGIYLFSFLSNVKSYHNNLINNSDQASNELRQYWDNGYPIGGNYWSDYIGVDDYKGPNQDQPGSDSIGDTPYVIDGNSKDNYPLIKHYTHRVFENYTILNKGWNLISIPLIQEEQSLNKVLEMIDGWYDAVRVYYPSDPTDPWKHTHTSKPFGNDLTNLNETMGFWIHITKSGESMFVYNGTAPTTSQQIRLYKGWNLVGYPSLTSYNRTDGLNNTEFGMNITKIMWYDTSSKTWQTMEETDYFHKGVGYWFHAKEDIVWHVPL